MTKNRHLRNTLSSSLRPTLGLTLLSLVLPAVASAALRIHKIQPEQKRIVVRFSADAPLSKGDALQVESSSSETGERNSCTFKVTAILGQLAAARSSDCPDVSVVSPDATVSAASAGSGETEDAAEAPAKKSRSSGFRAERKRRQSDRETKGFSKSKSSVRTLLTLGYGFSSKTADGFPYNSTGTEVYGYSASKPLQIGLGFSLPLGSESNPWGLEILGVYSTPQKVTNVDTQFVPVSSGGELSFSSIILQATPWLQAGPFQVGIGLNYSLPTWSGSAAEFFPVKHSGGLGFQISGNLILSSFLVGAEYQVLGSKIADNPSEAATVGDGSGVTKSVLLKAGLRL
ncbi:MAG: hypothetical protein KGQ59_07865 [Bdellovibrionales bacterium]|nr:hypothetical protein [Bdellovibrionales bacterium]